VFDPTLGWQLHPQVAVRPEPFGALLYHFGTRKLSFLKDRTILAIVQSLTEHTDARAACRAAGVGADGERPYLHALFRELREPQSAGACGSCGHYASCRGGCMAAKFFAGLPIDGPDPECVQGFGASALAARHLPRPSGDHSRRAPVALTLLSRPPARLCNERPV
jgi:putative mycofactocin binding protein MftB